MNCNFLIRWVATSVAAPLMLLPDCKALACSEATNSTIVPLPDLGVPFIQANGLNNTGEVVGFSFTPFGAMHAFLNSNGSTVDLTPSAPGFSQAWAVNSSGTVVGEVDATGNFLTRAFVYTNGMLVDIGTLGGSLSAAYVINDAGKVAGDSWLAGDLATEAFVYESGVMTSLGTLGGDSSFAVAINQSGNVAGDSFTAGNLQYHAFLHANGVMTDLGTLGGDYSATYGMNDSDVVVGVSSLASANVHAFSWSQGVMTDLGTLGGNSSTAYAVNNAGQIIGSSLTARGESHGFICVGGVMTDMGTLGGGMSEPTSLNARGQVAGYSLTSAGVFHAFIWQNDTLTDLNQLLPTGSGWELTAAFFINDTGRIVGMGTLNGVSKWFIMDLGSDGNAPPVAVAGTDQTWQCAGNVTLDGSASFDPDGDELTYEWSSGGALLGTAAVLTVNAIPGAHVVNLTVTDTCGSSASDEVVVTVADTIAPLIQSLPDSVSASPVGDCQAIIPDVTSSVVATDNCSGALTVTQIPAAGTLVGIGSHVITVTVTDVSGNLATGSVELSIHDTTAPVISSLAVSPDVLSPPNNQLVAVTVQVQVHDNCDAAPVTSITSVTSTDTTSPGDIEITGPLTLNLAARKGANGSERVYTIYLQSTDASGNSSSATVSVVVPKSQGNGSGVLSTKKKRKP